MEKPPLPTALYCRLSREDGDRMESDSIGNQRKLLESYIESHPELVTAECYADDGYTGTNFQRPAFQRMLRDIESGRIRCVLVKDLSRFGRDYIETGRYLERWLPEHGVRFIAVTDNIDSVRGAYDMMMPLKNLFNTQYARDISQKVKSSLHAKQQRGEFIGAFASYGYCKDPQNHNHLVIDPPAAEVVRRIFTLFENGMGKKWIWLAKIFAFFGAGVGLFGIGTFTQVNSIASAVKNFFDPDMAHTISLFGGNYSWATVIAGLFLTVCVGLVVLGGIQRIAKVSEVIVPFMAVLYVGLAVIIIITNITAVPAALASIVKSAFTGSALAGGAVGSVFVAMQKGVARGIFSNESGLGSAPIAAAAARTKEPVRQGLVSMTGTFIDTIVICTMTGLSIVIAGSWLNPELEGVAITMDAFQKGLPFPSFVATFSLMLCLVFFAFTTILGWNYYGERCVEYLFNRNKGVVMGYRILYILAVFIGPYMTVKAVWNIADIFNALMAFPNLIALLALNGVIVKETRDFHAKHNGSY